MADDRIACAVPYCGCSISVERNHYEEWLCRRHWTSVSPALRASHNRMKALVRKAAQKQRRYPYIEQRAAEVWEACKSEAIERAAGI